MINTTITMPATPTASPYAVAVSPIAASPFAGPAFAGPPFAGPAFAGPAFAGPAFAGPAFAGPAFAGPAFDVAGNAGSWRQGALDRRVAPLSGNKTVLATAHRTADMSELFGTRGRIGAVTSAAPPRGEPR